MSSLALDSFGKRHAARRIRCEKDTNGAGKFVFFTPTEIKPTSTCDILKDFLTSIDCAQKFFYRKKLTKKDNCKRDVIGNGGISCRGARCQSITNKTTVLNQKKVSKKKIEKKSVKAFTLTR